MSNTKKSNVLSTVPECRSALGAAVKSFRSAEGSLTSAAQDVAYALYYSTQTGYLSEAGKRGTVTQAEVAAMLGRSKAYVGLLLRAGRAYVVHGIVPSSEQGRALISMALANVGDVSKVIREDAGDGTTASLRGAIDVAKMKKVEQAAERTAKKRAPSTKPPKETNGTRLDQIETLLAGFRLPLSKADRERVAGLAERVAALLDADDTANADKTAEAAKAAKEGRLAGEAAKAA